MKTPHSLPIRDGHLISTVQSRPWFAVLGLGTKVQAFCFLIVSRVRYYGFIHDCCETFHWGLRRGERKHIVSDTLPKTFKAENKNSRQRSTSPNPLERCIMHSKGLCTLLRRVAGGGRWKRGLMPPLVTGGDLCVPDVWFRIGPRRRSVRGP